MSMRWPLIFKFVVLLTVANGAPVIATKLFGNFLNQPLDRGASFVVGRPILGDSKTLRGIVLSLVATTAFAPILGFEWILGLIIASAAVPSLVGACSCRSKVSWLRAINKCASRFARRLERGRPHRALGRIAK
jgi:hypothetical protein